MVKAILIDPETQTLEAIELSGQDDIESLIGHDTVASDRVGEQGDRLYFDEECFIRATPGRFRIDALVPVAGRGVVAGTASDGTTLADVSMSVNALRARTTFQ